MNHHDIARIVESMPKVDLQGQGIVCLTINRFGLDIQLNHKTFLELYPYVVPEEINGHLHYQVRVPGAKVVAVHKVVAGVAA